MTPTIVTLIEDEYGTTIQTITDGQSVTDWPEVEEVTDEEISDMGFIWSL